MQAYVDTERGTTTEALGGVGRTTMLNTKLLTELVRGDDELILRYWDSDEGCLEASCAVAIRAFMRARRILDARQGIRLFFALHPERVRALTGLRNLGASSNQRVAA